MNNHAQQESQSTIKYPIVESIGILLLAFIGLVVGSGISQGLIFVFDLEPLGTVGFTLSLVVSQVVAFGLIGVIYLQIRHNGVFSFLKYNKKLSTELLNLILGTVVVMIAISVATNLISFALDVQPAENTIAPVLEESILNVIAFIIITIVVVGPLEELLFRGIIQETLHQKYSPHIAIGVTSLLFAVVHIGAMIGSVEEMVPYLVSLFLGSIVLGLLYHKTENLIAPILAHGMYNAVIVVPLLFDVL